MGGYSPTAVMETNEVPMVGGDAKSVGSARSARSGRSSAVMERAREYNRRIDEVRARSVERGSARSDYGGSEHSNTGPRRSTQSNGGGGNGGRSGVATRERALASVQRESPRHNANGTPTAPFSDEKQQQRYGHSVTSPRSIQSTSTYSHRSAGTRGHTQDSPYDGARDNNNSMEALEENDYKNISSNANTPHENYDSVGDRGETSGSRRSPQTVSSGKSGHSRPASVSPKSPSKSKASMPPQQKEEQNPDVIVTPELLVDALSGHEDGLLAIAERLMEHYDAGYDVMGEAIIDAFADVQKLFQHVVEAAHMEGAAFEASRREEEMAELRKRAEGSGVPIDATDPLYYGGAPKSPANDKNNSTPTGPSRHDEFIDQDVRDVLTDAIRKGIPLRNKGSHVECYSLYEGSCNNASSLLPVDSDHRGRLQLSIARAESMSPDRACAILRYAMDDVLRSGLNTTRAILPDTSKRGDCVLDRPTASRSSGSGDLNGNGGKAGGPNGVVQSSEEALASLVEEMKEVMGAPVYDNTPLQAVAKRFWVALGEAQRSGAKNEEKLEQSLGKLKGEFLLARAEWEEKLGKSEEVAASYRERYEALRDSSQHVHYMERARSGAAKLKGNQNDGLGYDDDSTGFGSHDDRTPRKGESVVSLGNGLAHHARSIASSFSCVGTEPSDNKGENYRRSRSAPRGERKIQVSTPSDASSTNSPAAGYQEFRKSYSASKGNSRDRGY